MHHRRYLVLAGFLLLVSAAVSAQDPTKAAPDAYRLQFENDQIRVLRVHYAAHARVPIHDHSAFPAAYIYLNDSGPINFTHTGWDDPLLTRRAVRERSFRLSPTTTKGETHAVENPGDTASDFLRIEFKKLQQGTGFPHGRYAPDEVVRPDKFEKVEFENENVRITRSRAPAGRQLTLLASMYPSLIAFLNTGASGGKHPLGSTVWLRNNQSLTVDGDPGAAAEVLRIELKDPGKALK